MRKVIGIQRDERFSPNSVEKDLAILRAVVDFSMASWCLKQLSRNIRFL